MVLGQLDIHMQKNEVGPRHTPFTKINSKWITGLNVKPKAIKLLEEIMEVNPHDFGLDAGVLHAAPKGPVTEEKNR